MPITLASGASLTAGQKLTLGALRFEMQTDDNIVLYRDDPVPNTALWAADRMSGGMTMPRSMRSCRTRRSLRPRGRCLDIES